MHDNTDNTIDVNLVIYCFRHVLHVFARFVTCLYFVYLFRHGRRISCPRSHEADIGLFIDMIMLNRVNSDIEICTSWYDNEYIVVLQVKHHVNLHNDSNVPQPNISWMYSYRLSSNVVHCKLCHSEKTLVFHLQTCRGNSSLAKADNFAIPIELM